MKYAMLSIFAVALLVSGCMHTTTPAFEQNSTTTNTKSDTPTPITDSNDGHVLDLHARNLTQIPADVFEREDLEVLNVSNNQLTGAIQAEIRHLQNLRVLDASNNQMTGVPAEIGQLHNLETLNLANNRLTGLPHELGNLQQLKTLNISGNNYSEADLNIIENRLPAAVTIIK